MKFYRKTNYKGVGGAIIEGSTLFLSTRPPTNSFGIILQSLKCYQLYQETRPNYRPKMWRVADYTKNIICIHTGELLLLQEELTNLISVVRLGGQDAGIIYLTELGFRGCNMKVFEKLGDYLYMHRFEKSATESFYQFSLELASSECAIATFNLNPKRFFPRWEWRKLSQPENIYNFFTKELLLTAEELSIIIAVSRLGGIEGLTHHLLNASFTAYKNVAI